MTIDDVKAFLSENKDAPEVQEFIAGFGGGGMPTADQVREFIATEEGKLVIQPVIDSTVTKAIKTRDKAHEQAMNAEVSRRVAAEMLKLNPQEEPWQKEMREVRENLENERKERARDNMKRQLVEEAARMGVDPFFIDDYLPESIEVGKLYLQKIAARDKAVIQKANNELLAAGSYKPAAGQGKDAQKIDLSKLSRDELVKMEQEGSLDSAIA